VTCYTQPCKPCKVVHIMHYIPRGDESSPRGGWGICAPALPEVLTSGVAPLQFSALEQSPAVLYWIQSWKGVLNLEVRSPEGWYTNGHYQGIFIWPPLRLRQMRFMQRLRNCARLCTNVHNLLTFSLHLL
jgi:hypothetical protein